MFFGLRCKVSQCDASGIPEVLLRFQAAISCGWIEGPSTGDGYANAYKWAAGAADSLACLEKLWPQLGVAKRAQALQVATNLDATALRRRHAWRDAVARFAATHTIEESAKAYRIA